MGLFNSIKNIFKKEKYIEENIQENTSVINGEKTDQNNNNIQIYEKGLTKTRATFVSRQIGRAHV